MHSRITVARRSRSIIDTPTMLLSRRNLATQDNTVASRRLRSAKQRALPNLLIPGCQRCGTTSMYNYLVQHPLVMRTLWKEVHFFDKEHNYEKGADWYRAHFVRQQRLDRLQRQSGHPAYAVDATPDYIVRSRSLSRMAALLPEARIIILMRNPVDRAYSHYHNALGKRRESESFGAAVDQELTWYDAHPHMLADATVDRPTPPRRYLTRGIYVSQLRRLHERYPPEQVRTIRSEDLFEDVQRAYDGVLAFLELPPHRIRKTAPRNVMTYTDRVSPEMRARLTEFFAPLNRELYDYLGRDLNWD